MVSSNQFWRALKFALPAVLVLTVTSATSILLYQRSGQITEDQIKDHITSLATVAAMQFSGDALTVLQNPNQTKTPLFREVVERLQNIRNADPRIRFAYILRKNRESKRTLLFVADADSLATKKELDLDKNGTVDDTEEASTLGDIYDASAMPAIWQAFEHPSVDASVTQDQWGSFISGYAPIQNSNNETVAIIGLDIRADTFYEQSRSVFSPAALLVVLAIGALCALYVEVFLYRRRMEVLQEVEDSKSRFLAVASHQLRTSITAMRWTLETLTADSAKDLPHEQRQQLLLEAKNAAGQMGSSIETMMHVASLEAGKNSVAVTEVNTCALLNTLKSEYEPEALKKNLQMTWGCTAQFAPFTDASLLHEILSQILLNAILYTPNHGSIDVHVSSTSEETVFTIHDTGIGISAEEQEHLFTKFYRGKNAMIVHTAGTGLGLYLVQLLTKLLGGRLTLSSEEGVGTTVAIHIDNFKQNGGRDEIHHQ